MREHLAGAAVFRRKDGKILFLLLKSAMGHWEFPKGLVEKGEDEETTVRRETREETGIENLVFVGGFKKAIKYFFTVPDEGWRISKGASVSKTVNFYAAEAQSKDVKISSEHEGFRWVEYKEAIELLEHKNYRDVLEAVCEKLK